MVQYFLAQHAPQDRLQPHATMNSPNRIRVANVTSLQEDESENSELPSGNEEQDPNNQLGSVSGPSEADVHEHLLPWKLAGSSATAETLTPLSNGALGTRTGGTPPQRGTLRKTYTRLPRDRTLLAPRKRMPPQDSVPRKCVYECKRCRSSDIECIRDQQNPSKKRKSDGRSTTHRKFSCRACGCHKVTVKPEFVATVGSSSVESDVEYVEQRKEKKTKIKLESSPRSKASLNDSVVVLSPPLEDSIDHFSKYVTSLMRLVPAKRALRLQKEVISLVLEDQIRSSDSSD